MWLMAGVIFHVGKVVHFSSWVQVCLVNSAFMFCSWISPQIELLAENSNLKKAAEKSVACSQKLEVRVHKYFFPCLLSASLAF